MADTSVQVRVEDWVRKNWLPPAFNTKFRRDRVELDAGGRFDFDGVSEDDSIVVSISTSGAVTASGKYAVGKMMKIRSDVLFLLMAMADRRVLVLTEQDMFEACQKEAKSGRLPKNIEIRKAEIPEELRSELEASRAKASKEVSPWLVEA